MQCPKCKTDNPDESVFCAKCGTQIGETEEKPLPTQTIEAPKEELTTGSTFAGRYQIIEELGKGGMGKVYKAHDTEIKEKIALKLIKPEISADKKTIERFQNELKFARKIGHRNVCRMYDLNKEEGSYYITMEYVSGEDLKSFIRRVGQLPSGKAISIAKQVTEGLAEAHRLGVIHRDLKPSNIMIDKDGNARIMDFGIARSVEAKGITGAGVMIGTPEYMPPEQAEAKEVDQRSDIYSLGVILYEMVTGRVPFEGDTALSIAMKHKGEEPKDPREFNSQISEDLSRVILRCLAKEKDKRYQSAGEVRSELESIEKGIPTTERIIPERKPLTSREITVTFGIKKLLIPALVIIAVVIIGLVLWQVMPKRHAVPSASSDKPSLAVMYFENNTGDANMEHWRKALAELITDDLSQSRHLTVLGVDKLFGVLKEENLLDVKNYSSEDLKKVASQGGVENILRGSFSKAGETIRIHAVLQNMETGELLGTERVECQGEERIFSAVDELTLKIKRNFKMSEADISSDSDREVGKITTGSPEAYMYYREARELSLKGEDSKALQLMLKAVEIDPQFAMAYRDLGMSYSNLGYYNKSREYMKKAYEYKDRLSDKERYLIEAGFFSDLEETLPQAIEAYEKVIEFYPDVWIAHNNLASIYNQLEQWDAAEKACKVSVDGKIDNIYPYVNLAIAYQGKGMFEKARETLDQYQNNFGESAWIQQYIAANYFYQGKLDLALAEIDKAFLLQPDDFSIGANRADYYYLQGKFVDAEREYRNLLNLDEARARYEGMRKLASLYLTQGKFEKAKEQMHMALDLADEAGEQIWTTWLHIYLGWIHFLLEEHEEALNEYKLAGEAAAAANLTNFQRYILIWEGFLYARNKSFGEAEKFAAEYKTQLEKTRYQKTIRFYNYLIGLIELEKGSFSKAIQSLEEGLALESFGPLGKSAVALELLASANYEVKNLDKARENYEEILALTYGRLWYGYHYARSFYMLGKIYDQQGNKAKAIENYEKFLALWKDADPGIAKVDDANARLAALKK
jgi:serine/threonine protein kinase/tetratricopeptide (TPR) repeat protein